MINRLESKYCTACFACVQKCPIQCIAVIQDEEGFYVPRVDVSQCTNCGLCVASCPQLAPAKLHTCLHAYAAQIKDDELLKQSTSGGLFPLLAQYVLKVDGVVFGVNMDKYGIVKNMFITDKTDLSKLQGSKYVQSFVGNTYQETEIALKEGKTVLFSGTPCQIAGLYNYLGKDYDNLVSMDVVCHGVPSQDLFLKFRKWLGERHKAKVVSWDFRCKETEGWAQIDKIRYSSKTIHQRELLNPYSYAFLLGHTLRESCYYCKYACGSRVADITVGDYWGIRNVHPSFYSSKGVSLLLVNTERGNRAIEAIKNSMKLLPSRLSDMQKFNGNLVKPSKRPPQRDKIYRHLQCKPIDRFVCEDLKVPFDYKEHLKTWIPYSTRQKLKKIMNVLWPNL